MERRISCNASLNTSASFLLSSPFKARTEGTPLDMTEQGVFLDAFEDARDRERGTQRVINQLEQALNRQSMSARS
jgi:hypothetical protein